MYSSTIQASEILQSNAFGKLKKIKIFEGGIIGGTNKPQNHYQNDSKMAGGGILFERGSHTLSQVTRWFKDCELKCLSSKVTMQDDLDVDVKAVIAIGNPYNVNLHYRISLVEPISDCTQLIYNDATIVFDQTDASSQLQVYDKDINNRLFSIDININYASTIVQGHYLKIMEFIDKVNNIERFNSEYDTSLGTTRLIEEIYKVAGIN